MEKLIICPNEWKLKILKDLEKEDRIKQIKFMTKEEYLNKYYYTYNELALEYLMDNYNYQIDVAKVYLNNLMVIDKNKEYNNPKLKFLSNIKNELIKENLLIYHPTFKEYLKNKEIIVEHYYDLDLYEEEALNIKIDIPKVSFNKPIYEFQTMEDEVNFVCLKIIELLNSGVDINKIFLVNVSSDYNYTINKLFSYYNIPVLLNKTNSIYSTKVVKDYLTEGILDLEDNKKSIIMKKLLKVLGDLSILNSTGTNYKKILIDKLKNTKINEDKLTNCISIKDLYNSSFNDDEYIFVLGFNQDSLPKLKKDIEYLDDKLKDEVPMYKTSYLNKRIKASTIYILSNIKNIFISYKLRTPFQEHYPSSLINEYNLKVEHIDIDKYNHSNFYNKLRLSEKLDLYNLYKEESPFLKKLNTHYTIPYLSYSNKYTLINKDNYQKHLPYPLKLSYTSLNTYNECSFKYYLKYVLKLDEFEDTFSSFIGSLYHEILSLYRNYNFDFEKEYHKYLEKRDLSLKEKLLLVRIKKDLLTLIDELKKQQYLTGYDDYYNEKYFEVDVESEVSVKFIGFIDKIMYYKNMEDIYFSIVDYKSGSIDTHIEPMKYGLHMQLPIYLYLINYSNAFKSPIFTGIYYQNILFSYPTWSPKLESENKKKYLLNGYSTTDINILEGFDTTYENSELIKSMKYKDDKFGAYSKVIDNDTLYELVKYTKRVVEDNIKKIVNGDFSINPKIYDGKNISCEFCKFRDICFVKDKDNIYLEHVSDLSFLGGEE